MHDLVAVVHTWGPAAITVILGFVAVAVVSFMCVNCLQRDPMSHHQIPVTDVEFADKPVEEIPHELKESRLKEMRRHWEASDGIIVKDLPRLAKKLSVKVDGTVVLRNGKIISDNVEGNINTSEAVGNVLWELAAYGYQLAQATGVGPIEEVERQRYVTNDEKAMIELVTSHDLHSFTLRVARAINQQVIAPAFAFLYRVVDVPAGKPFLDSRGHQSWTVEIELPAIITKKAAIKKRMSIQELIGTGVDVDTTPDHLVIRHLRQSRCCLPPNSPNFFYFDWSIEIHFNADGSEMLESAVIVKEIFCEGGSSEYKAALNRWFRVGQRL